MSGRIDDRVPAPQIHGYELFLVPTFLTMHAAQSKTPIAFFLPTPFPSSEVESPTRPLPAYAYADFSAHLPPCIRVFMPA